MIYHSSFDLVVAVVIDSVTVVWISLHVGTSCMSEHTQSLNPSYLVNSRGILEFCMFWICLDGPHMVYHGFFVEVCTGFMQVHICVHVVLGSHSQP
jgi:hypothetical protein